MGKRTSSTDDKWLYKGRIELVDMDVVVGSALEDERRLEVLSPEGSFALYAGKQSHHLFCVIYPDWDISQPRRKG